MCRMDFVQINHYSSWMGVEHYHKIALILSILGGYLLTDTEAPNVDGHHPLPASHDFHPRNGENVLLEDSINLEGM